MSQAVENADKNIRTIFANAGWQNPPEQVASYIWGHPLLILLALALVFAVGAAISWAIELVWKRYNSPPPASVPPETIAEAVHYNNAANAGAPRFDDEHRGPAVSNSYSLSDCWIDLSRCSDAWPVAGTIPPGLIEFAQSVPEDQRADWVRRTIAANDVRMLVSQGMSSGSLPLWVAPIGGPEQEVDPKALLEIDHATIASGCYRPYNDRGWLFGRPLFVKRADWVRFRDEVQRTKGISPLRGGR